MDCLALHDLLFGSTNLSRCDWFSRRNREMKECTLTNCAFQRKLRSMFLHDPLCQSQPKSRSFRAATAPSIYPVKSFKHPRLMLPGDADSRVVNAEDCSPVLTCDLQSYGAARWCVARGIVEQNR